MGKCRNGEAGERVDRKEESRVPTRARVQWEFIINSGGQCVSILSLRSEAERDDREDRENLHARATIYRRPMVPSLAER